MKKSCRRNFIKSVGMAVPAVLLTNASCNSPREKTEAVTHNSGHSIKLGIASYTFREFSLEDTLQMTNQVGMTNIALKSMHLPLDFTDSQIAGVREKVNMAGITLYGAGVIYMNSEEEVLNGFRYAKAAGMNTIIGVPQHELLDLVEEQVKETGIKLAIHNHGPGDDLYPSPESIIEKVSNRDKRIGLCMDIGHTQRIGLDPATEAEKYFDRLLDVHLKDVDGSTAEGDTVEMGRGVIDIVAFLSVLIKKEFQGIASFEYEKDEKAPLPGLAESIGYVNGVLAVLNK